MLKGWWSDWMKRVRDLYVVDRVFRGRPKKT